MANEVEQLEIQNLLSHLEGLEVVSHSEEWKKIRKVMEEIIKEYENLNNIDESKNIQVQFYAKKYAVSALQAIIDGIEGAGDQKQIIRKTLLQGREED